MMKKMKLADVPFGKNFEIWGHTYTVLDCDDKGIFVLEADAVCEMPFREKDVDYKVAPNDFRDSSVRACLEEDYLEELIMTGAKLNHDILEMELDLQCTLGQHEYGVARVHAGLLTLEQYGKYYDIIPRIDTTYWLATPWKTPSRSPDTNYTNYVWSVYSNGNYDGWYCNGAYGVRPALTLSPSLLVSVSFTTKEQVEKMWKGKWIGMTDDDGCTWYECSRCEHDLYSWEDPNHFCPACGAPMTDAAVDMVMKRLEALYEETRTLSM